MKDINIVGQEFFATIEGNLDLIIDLFPLQYEKQKEVIAYIIDNLQHDEIPVFEKESTILSKEEKEVFNEEIIDLNKIKKGFYNYIENDDINIKKLEEICKEEIENIILTRIEYKIDLLNDVELLLLKYESISMKDKEELLKEYEQEKKYISELQNTQEKQRVIIDYKKFLETQQEQNIIALKKQQEDSRKGKPIDNIEEHALVQSGVLTKEEIAPIISSYELLNTLAAYNAGTEKVKELFNAARNFYPDNPAKGLNELTEIHHSKASYLLNDNILEFLQARNITFVDIKSLENNKLDKIKLEYSNIKKLLEFGLKIQELLSMETDQQKLFVENGFQVEKLVNSGLKMQELLGMEREQQESFIKNGLGVGSLIDFGLKIQELLSMETNQQKLFVENGFQVEKLINSGFKMQELLDMEREQQEFFIKNDFHIEKLVNSGLGISNRQESNITNDNDLTWFDNTDYNLSEVDLMGLD